MDNTCYCLKCDMKRPYKVLSRCGTLDIRGQVVGFIENYAVCSVCGDELYVPKVSDSNIGSVQAAYDKLKEEKMDVQVERSQ